MKRFIITGAFAVAIAGTLFFTNTFASGIPQSASEKTFTISESELNSANINKSTPADKQDSKGSIEYSKVTTKTVGSNDMIIENWFDTNTYDNRGDTHIINIIDSQDKQVNDIYNSVYMKDQCKKSVYITRDDKGLPVSGSITEYSDRVAKYNFSNASKGIFDQSISEYKKAEWKLVSTQTSDDGKKLKKLSCTSKILIPDEESLKNNPGTKSHKDCLKEYTSVKYVYIDEANGLPVKSETYIDKDGKTTLYSEETFEFKRLSNTDSSIFDTSGVKLEIRQKVDFDPEKSVG